MSFRLTIKQIKNRTKTVTRRLGWWFLKPGDILNACEKCQGLKKGEHIRKLCQIQVVSTKAEYLNMITEDDCKKEGFPHLMTWEFVRMFKEEIGCRGYPKVNRIKFKYV